MRRRCIAPYPTRPTRPLEHSHCWAKPTRTVRVHCEHILMWSECTGRTRRSGRSVYTGNPTRTVRERYARRVKLPVCTRPNYRANDVAGRVAVWPCGNRLLERLMSPSPKSQVMFASAFSWIGDLFRIFVIRTFYATATLLNMLVCMQWTCSGGSGADWTLHIASRQPLEGRCQWLPTHRCGVWTLYIYYKPRARLAASSEPRFV